MRLLFTKTFFFIGFCFLTGHCALAAAASSGKWEQLLAAGKKEGEVVMIGPTIPDLRQAYTEEWGWLGGPTDPRRLYVRRITVHRPGDEDVSVVTDLLDGETYPATDILDMYLRRWGIEKLFQKVTEVFHLQALVSSRENGTVFQAALCLLLYNMTVVVRAYVAEGAQCATTEVPLEKLFVDTCRQLTGMVEVLGTAVVIRRYSNLQWGTEQLRRHLKSVLGQTWRDWWKKSPPKKKSEPTPTEYLIGGHSSVFKITRGLHRTKPERKKKTDGLPGPSKQ